MAYSIDDSSRALNITNLLNDFVKSGREYQGEDKDSIATRDLLNRWNTDGLRDDLVNWMIRTQDDDGKPIQRMSDVLTADETSKYFLDQLKGWDQLYNKMDTFRLMNNKMEDERQKAEAAVEAQKEIAQKTADDMQKAAEKQADEIKQLNDQMHDIDKLERLFGLKNDEASADKNGSQTDTANMGVGQQAQGAMQQIAPEVAQATPQPAPSPDMSQPPAPSTDMGAGAPPGGDLGGTPPADMGGMPPSPVGDMGGTPPADMNGMPPASPGGDSGMFQPSDGMINAVQPHMGM